MEATQVFQNILQIIENSRLNYSLSKTPFSATISLKCSFIKRFHEQPQPRYIAPEETNIFPMKNPPRTSLEKDVQVVEHLVNENRDLKAEVDRLKDVIDRDHKKVLEETVNLQIIYEHEKNQRTELERNLSTFREDLLKIKRDKHKLCDQLKVKDTECEELRTKVEELKEENDGLKKALKDKCESFDNVKIELLKKCKLIN